MLLLRALLLGLLVAMHLAAGAVLFRRLFPRESIWFGLIVPLLAVCVGLNFIEHFIPLPSLLGLLPFTTIGSLLLLARPNFDWPGLRARLRPARAGFTSTASESALPFAWAELRVPLAVLFIAFAYAFLIRCFNPSILASSDGLSDANLVGNFLQGGTVPPTDGWLPPFKLEYYYTFQHYGASVLTRLLGLDLGTGYNLAHALLSALVCVAAAAAAWRLTGRAWIALAMVVLIESAATGSSAYLWLTERDPSPWDMSNLSGGLAHRDSNPIWSLLARSIPTGPGAAAPEELELRPPGFWTYRDEYHPDAGGHFFTLVSVWLLFELLRPERRNWPWIGATLVPFLTIVTSTWMLPITAVLAWGGMIMAWSRRHRPENPTFVWGTVALGLACLWPTLIPLMIAPDAPPIMWTKPEWHTPFWEFVIQWWPVVMLWISLLVVWRKLPPELKYALVAVPLMFVAVECITIEYGRYNTVEKMWGAIYGTALVGFFPAVAMQRTVAHRVVAGIILVSAFISLCGWANSSRRWVDWSHNAWHLEGNGIVRLDPQRARILQVASQLHHATLLPGKAVWDYNDSPATAVFSGNRCYVAWFYSEERFGHKGESDFRTQQANDFYAGKMTDPLGFLVGHAIAGAVIWPDDAIPDALLADLKQQLASRYDYVDCRGDGANNAGIFLQRAAAAEGATPLPAP